MARAQISEDISIELKSGSKNEVRFRCRPYRLEVTANEAEIASTFYVGLRELGFLFPHPRVQISPSLRDLNKKCGQSFRWEPTLKYRGLHLHTLHPNEWVRGFFMDRPEVALEIVRWSARNTFNLLDVSLLRLPLEELEKKFSAPFSLARSLGVHTGVSLGVALHQQNSYKLLTLFEAFTGWGAGPSIERELTRLFENIDTSFVVIEAGTSEFTGTDPAATISWLNQVTLIAQKFNCQVFTKVHVSSNQHDKKYGNYNFLPKYATSRLGILPHTVMFYGLQEERAPMYGNKNFYGIRDFMLKEKNKRPTWYYPETGYWVAMDQDIPLILTDYLKTRADDLRFLHAHGIEGQLIFTTGHGLGGWLYDWTQALLTDRRFNFDPLIGLKLLGENASEWQKMIDYQALEFKAGGLIAMLSSANLQDELSSTHRIHERFTMRELSLNPLQRQKEAKHLFKAAAAWPEIKIKDEDLERLLLITRLRLEHAQRIREADFSSARLLRAQADLLLASSRQDNRNYADLGVWDEWQNPTSYQFGYLFPAASLYFWKREERMLKEDSFWPFTGNIYDIFDIVF